MRKLLVVLAFILQGCSGTFAEKPFDKLVRESGCITADQIYRSYQNNEASAQLAYQNRPIRVCGVVESVKLDLFDRPIVNLETSGWGSFSITNLRMEDAANLRSGTISVFECREINEVLSNPILGQCVIPILASEVYITPPPAPKRSELAPEPQFSNASPSNAEFEPAASDGAADATIRAFYGALGAGQGDAAAALVVPEKTSSGAFAAHNLTRFYGNMKSPVELISIYPDGTSSYMVRYRFTVTRTPCNGRAIVSIVQRNGRSYISEINALDGC